LARHIDCNGQLHEYFYNKRGELVREVHWSDVERTTLLDEIICRYDTSGNLLWIESTVTEIAIEYRYLCICQAEFAVRSVIFCSTRSGLGDCRVGGDEPPHYVCGL
jgi:hypothetical protein